MASGRSQELVTKGQSEEREVILQWIKAAWDSVTPDVVKKSFVKCGISSALDGSQDHLFGTDDEDDDPFEGFSQADVAISTQLNEAIDLELEAAKEADDINEWSDAEEPEKENPDDTYDCPNSPGH